MCLKRLGNALVTERTKSMRVKPYLQKTRQTSSKMTGFVRPVFQNFVGTTDSFSCSRLRKVLQSCKTKFLRSVEQAQNDPVHFWERGKECLFWYASVTFVVPFEITVSKSEGKTVFKFDAARGYRKWLSLAVSVVLALRCALFCFVLMDPDIWFEGDHMSPFAGIFAFFMMGSVLIIVAIVTVCYYKREILLLSNAFNQLNAWISGGLAFQLMAVKVNLWQF